MSDSETLLDLIEEGIVEHGEDFGGWTRRDEGTLQLFDGRITLRASVDEGESGKSGTSVHAHVLATLHEYDEEVLDACVYGMGDTRDAAIRQAAVIWITGVAGPIKSFLENQPVCMTCQVGVADGDTSQGYSRGDYGLPGLRAYVGPSFSRGIEDSAHAALDDTKPWFRFAAESAAPRRVHLAKSSIIAKGKSWSRELEIDGHDVSHHDPDWPAGVMGPEFGYLIRFAVFEFPLNSAEVRRRAELERTIREFALRYSRYETMEQLQEAMVGEGFDPDLVHETESISTIAFGRALFESQGVDYSPTIIRARRDGRVEPAVPLMSLPAFSRARALAPKLYEQMKPEEFQALCLYNAESHAILQAIEAGGKDVDLSKVSLFPCVVPDRGVSDQTMNAALSFQNTIVEKRRSARRKPWWKFW